MLYFDLLIHAMHIPSNIAFIPHEVYLVVFVRTRSHRFLVDIPVTFVLSTIPPYKCCRYCTKESYYHAYNTHRYFGYFYVMFTLQRYENCLIIKALSATQRGEPLGIGDYLLPLCLTLVIITEI